MIAVIPWTWPLRKRETAAPAGYDPGWLPRGCPLCGGAVIGHGWRNKQAHDQKRTRIRVHRGICKNCGKTITVLPAWSLPYTHYTLYARQQAWHRWLDGARLEEAAPLVQDPDRVADPSTLRRWIQRRWEGWWRWMAGWRASHLLPTIFAWDWPAALRILNAEPEPS